MKRKTRSDEDELIHSDDVEVVDFVEMNLNDAIVIAGFPSIGLVSTIVSNYLIDALSLEQIGALNSMQVHWKMVGRLLFLSLSLNRNLI